MRKTILKTVSTLMFLCIASGCNSNSTSSNISTSSTSKIVSSSLITNTNSSISNSVITSLSSTINTNSTSLTTSSIIKEKSFEEILKEIQTPNITYRSDYLIYYYTNENPSEIIELQRFDVYAKITEDLYDMKAYVYGEKTIASYAHLEKDEDGYVSYSDININNDLVVRRAVDGQGEEFLWDESVYFNLIQYLNPNDFNLVNKDTYVYIGDLKSLPLSIIHTAVPVSKFNLESLMVKVKDGVIESFNFQEIESDQAYENCMYGRNVNLTFENINTTEIERIEPYEDKIENEDLRLALEDIRSQTNYTIKSEGILVDDSVEPLQESYITESDILQVQHTEEGEFKTGLHTYNDELYLFESIDKYLLGKKAESTTKIKNFIPKFYFSEDVFELLKEEDGYKIYRPYPTMTAVLNYIDVNSYYEEAYYAPEGDIEFFVKDGKLEKIEFPVFLYSTSDYRKVINRITYENIGSTIISETSWESFVLELPKNEASAWNDSLYDFMFEFDAYNSEMMNLGILFEKCLGSANEIPYFLMPTSNVSISGNYSSSPKPIVYVIMTSLKGIDYELLNNINQILPNNDFKKSTFSDELMNVEIFRKDNIQIEIIMIPMENHMEISFELPVGSLFK